MFKYILGLVVVQQVANMDISHRNGVNILKNLSIFQLTRMCFVFISLERKDLWLFCFMEAASQLSLGLYFLYLHIFFYNFIYKRYSLCCGFNTYLIAFFVGWFSVLFSSISSDHSCGLSIGCVFLFLLLNFWISVLTILAIKIHKYINNSY